MSLTVLGGNVGGGPGPAPPTQEQSYTPTHYVEAKGTAAANQSDDGQGAYDAATNPATPCSLKTAMNRAQPGDVVQCAAGSYNYAGNVSNKWVSAFDIINNGTAAQPIIFFAEYPAAYNLDSPSLWTQFIYDDYSTYTGGGGQGGTHLRAIGLASTIGTLGNPSEYKILDGFMLDNDTTPQNLSAGMLCFSGAQHCEVRRFYCRNLHGAGGQNPAFFFGDITTDVQFRDCVLESSYAESYELTETYSATDVVFDHCVVKTASAGIYFKGTFHSGCIVRYCHFTTDGIPTGGIDPIVISSMRSDNNPSVTIHNNLIEGNYGQPLHADTTVSALALYGAKVYNNTFYRTGGGRAGTQTTFRQRASSPRENVEFWNNIWVCPASNGQIWLGTVIGVFDLLDYQLYFELGGGDPFWNSDVDQTGLTNWKNYSGQDTNSTQEDPLFTDPGSGDFTLQPSSPARSGGRGGAYSSVRGCYITGNEEIGLRANPTY